MRTLSYESVLERGFAIVFDAEGNPVKQAASVSEGTPCRFASVMAMLRRSRVALRDDFDQRGNTQSILFASWRTRIAILATVAR